MANNYCESSTLIEIPKDKVNKAKVILTRVNEELELSDDEGYVGYIASFENNDIWIRHDESINPEHVEVLVKALVEELELPGTIVCSWSYTCSKPRIDEFGGGAFAVQKGKPTRWVDARETAIELTKQN